MRIRAASLFVALGFASSAACGRKKIETIGTSAIADTPENKPFSDIDRDAIDSRVSPCVDFYAYACGGWTSTPRIPDDEAMWSKGFHEARTRNEKILRSILERDTVDPPASEPYSAQLGDFFASCMDDTAIDAHGEAELDQLLDTIDTRDPDALAKSVAHLHLLGVPALFVLEPEPDLHNAHRIAAVVRQPPPARSSDALDEKLFSAYEARSVLHDTSRASQIVDAAALVKIAPNFRWKTYFSELGISPPSAIHLATPAYLSAMDRIIAKASADELHATLHEDLLHALAPFSTHTLAKADLEQRSRETGVHTLPERSKFCAREADALLGGALSVAFVRRAMTDADLARARALSVAMTSVLQSEIDSLAWMDSQTRAVARKKIESLSIAIGIPAEKPARADFTLERSSFLSDVVQLRARATRIKLATIGHASDPTAWRISGSTVNAYFDPRKNELVIPAGILAPPIFDERDRHAFAFESILGHELVHALDGRFDENGNDASWWSAQTLARYHERLACVRRDLEAASASEKLDLQVSQILDESVADSGGLRLAYRAMKRESATDEKTRDQAFFTAFAQLWCTELRPEALANFVADDPHPPPHVRVNRALRDLPELAKAFSCNDGDAMTKKPADRCDVW
ncbi:MAG: M13 family metallopeptidase [Polyangiaceae bacterium]